MSETQSDTRVLGLCAARYCEVPFPPYAYVPGRTPHPRRHPEGHMHGRPEPPAAPLDPERWAQSTEYLYGCDLYNHGYWWEAHEAWEAIWKPAPKHSPQRLLLQGLIQTGAAHLKFFLGQPDGTRRLYERAVALLKAAAGGTAAAGDSGRVFMGLRVSEFIRGVEGYYAPRLCAANDPLPHDPAGFPLIVLQLSGA